MWPFFSQYIRLIKISPQNQHGSSRTLLHRNPRLLWHLWTRKSPEALESGLSCTVSIPQYPDQMQVGKN